VSLAAAGLVDNIPMDVDLAERLNLLAEHESAWEDTPWFPIEGYDGVLGLAASSGNLLVFFRLWDDSVRFGRQLVFQRLPSIHQGVPDFTSRMDPDFHVHEFSVDSSQDLLIYAQYVHEMLCFISCSDRLFRSGSRLATREVGTNRPHPASSGGVLSLRKNEFPIATTTRIYGELAACLTTLIDDGSLRFRIFNWTTGQSITESVRVQLPSSRGESLTESCHLEGGNFSPLRYEFLDADHIFYSSSEALSNYPNLVVENIRSSCRTVLRLDFPDIVPGTNATCYLSIPQNSMPHTWANNRSAGYFCDDLSDRLIVLNVVSYGWGAYHSCHKQQQTLHISTNAILSYVRAHPSGGSVPWDAWGPGNVRVVPRRTVVHETVTGMHTLCGMRAVHDHIVKDRRSRPVICVYDYHRGRVGRALFAQGNGASSGAGMWTTMRRSLSTKYPEPPALAPYPVATSYVLPGGEKEMSCLVKEIPIPKGLLVDNLMCVLCEHAVVLLEVSELAVLPSRPLADYCTVKLSDRRLGAPISGVFYHAI
jgi:hypothetical protein